MGRVNRASFQSGLLSATWEPGKASNPLDPLPSQVCNFQTNRNERKSRKNGGMLRLECPLGYTGGEVGIHGFTLSFCPPYKPLI
jgi:hypothetical protein